MNLSDFNLASGIANPSLIYGFQIRPKMAQSRTQKYLGSQVIWADYLLIPKLIRWCQTAFRYQDFGK